MGKLSRRGYSLVEVMVAVAVAGVLAAMGVSYVGRMAGSAEVYSNGKDVVQRLNECRRWSIDHNQPCAFAVELVDPAFNYPNMGGAFSETTFYGSAANTLAGLYAADRCWDIFPADPFDSARPCAGGWEDQSPGYPTVYNESTRYSVFLAQTNDPSEEPRVSLVGIGGEANTAALSIRAGGTSLYSGGTDRGWLAPDPGAVVFMPNGRLLNDKTDFDCSGNINLWLASRHDWTARHEKTFVEISVSRTGTVSWRNGEQAHVDPYPGAQQELMQQDKNACPTR